MNKTDFIVDHAPGLKAATKALQEINKRLENAPESFFDKWEADAKAGRDPLARFDDELATFVGDVATNPQARITVDLVVDAALENYDHNGTEPVYVIDCIEAFAKYVKSDLRAAT